MVEGNCKVEPVVPPLRRPHDWLCQKSTVYSRWHSNPTTIYIHYAILTLYILLLAIGTLFYNTSSVGAASQTWDGGCGADTNWSCANNWSTNTVPAAGDIITFDATSTNNSTVDSLFNATETITTINMNAGYTGTITLGTTLHVTTSFVQHAGIFTAANQTLDMNGSFTLDAGTFTASSGSTTLAGAMTISGTPIFAHNSGTFTFDGAVTATLTCNNVVFNLVTLSHTGSISKTVGATCSLPLGNNPMVGGDTQADVVVNGTLSGTGTLQIGTASTANILTMNSGSALVGFSGLLGGALTTSATQDFSSYTSFILSGAYTQTGGTVTVPSGADFNSTFALSSAGVFNAPSGTVTFASTFTLNTGTTFNANGGTVVFDGSASSAVLTCNNVVFNLVTLSHTGSISKTVGATCSLPLGNNPMVGGDTQADVVVNGTLSGTGTLQIGTASTANILTMNSGSALVGFSGLLGGALAISATQDFSSYTSFILGGAYTQTGGTVTIPNGADFNNTFTLSSGVFNAPAGTATFASTFTISGSPTFNANGGTVTFDGTGSSVVLTCNNAVFNLVTLAHTSNISITVGATCSLPLGNNPTIGADGAADVILNGTLSGTGTLKLGTASTTNALTLNSGSSLSGFSGLLGGSLTTSATQDFSSYTSFILSGAYIQTGGTVTVPNGAIFDNTFSQTGGTFTVLGGADFNSTFSLSSTAVFNAPSGTATFASTFTISGSAIFNASGGTVTFDGVTATLTCNNVTFNLVTFAHIGSVTKTVGATCILPLGNNPSLGGDGNADVTLTGTLSGTGTLQLGTASSGNLLTMNSGSALSGFNGLVGGTLSISTSKDFSSYTSFVLGGTYSQTGGTVTVPSGADFNGIFALNSGAVFNAPSGTVTFASNFTVNTGTTFNANGGTITFDDETTQTITCNNAVFNLVTFNTTSSIKTIASSCTLPLGASPTLPARLLLNGVLSGTGTLTTAQVLDMSTSSSLSGFTGFVGNASVTVSGGTLDLGTYTTVDFNDVFTLSAGSFTAPASTATFASTFTISGSPTFNANGGTVTFDGAAADINVVTSQTFNNLTFASSDGISKTIANDDTLVVIGTLTLTDGTIDQVTIPVTGTIAAQGPVLLGAGFDGGTSHLLLNGSASRSVTLTGGGQLPKTTVDGPNTVVNGPSSGVVTAQGDLTVLQGTIIGAAGDLMVSGNFIQSGGAVIAPSGTLTVTGSFDHAGGAFAPNSGTVLLNGTNQQVLGSTSFYNLTKTTAGSDTLTFQAGAIQTIANALTLNGVTATLLALRSTVPGTQWQLDPQGSRTIQFLDVQDSRNTNTTAIVAYGTGSVDSGNNFGWSFVAPTTTTTTTPTTEPPTTTTTEPTPTTMVTTTPTIQLISIGTTKVSDNVKHFTYQSHRPRPVFAGTTETGNTVTVTAVHDGTDSTLCTTTGQPNGTWSCITTSILAFGDYTVTITATAGDTTTSLTPFTLLTEDAAPAAEPILTTPEPTQPSTTVPQDSPTTSLTALAMIQLDPVPWWCLLLLVLILCVLLAAYNDFDHLHPSTEARTTSGTFYYWWFGMKDRRRIVRVLFIAYAIFLLILLYVVVGRGE